MWREPAELNVHAEVAGPTLSPHPHPPPGGTGHRRGPTESTADWQQEGQEVRPHYLVRNACMTDTGLQKNRFIYEMYKKCLSSLLRIFTD